MKPEQKQIILETVDDIGAKLTGLHSELTFLKSLLNAVDPDFFKAPIPAATATHFPSNRKRKPIFKLNQIAALAAATYNVPIEQLYRNNRIEEVVLPRQLAMHLSVAHGYKLVTTGNHFGKDHGTVLHAIRSVQDRMDVNADFHDTVEALISKLNGDKQQPQLTHGHAA
jgi:chromosomal replication initiation ATPase DnaA